MPLLTEPTEVATMINDKLKLELIQYGFKDIIYGDRDPVNMPAVTTEVVDKKFLYKPGGRIQIEFAAYLLVYYAQYTGAESAREQSDEKGQNVVTVLNSDYQWRDEDGEQRLIKGWVTRFEPGYATRNRSVYYVSRITWEALSQAPLNI